MAAAETDRERLYQIGTVSTLTGIDPHTIRAWERRYGASTPSRSESGRRRYDDPTVERLQLLKALVNCSESIGLIANLPDEALRERLSKLAEVGRNRAPVDAAIEIDRSGRSLALIAPALESQLRANAVALPELEIVVSAEDHHHPLESSGGPSDDAPRERALATSEPPAANTAPPARRFDDDQLAKLFEVGSGIDCECPNHLSSLVSELVAFERYSESCEFRDEADARLHRRLAEGAGRARALLESMLAQLCEQEGIEV